MRTTITAIVGILAVWLRERGIVDMDQETADAITATLLFLCALFLRRGVKNEAETVKRECAPP